VSPYWVAAGLFAFAGFLVGGVYSLWRTARGMAVVLGVAAALSVVGGIFWLL
jgi:hypothetical protein